MGALIVLLVGVAIVGGLLMLAASAFMLFLAFAAAITLFLLPGFICGLYEGIREWRNDVLEERKARDSNPEDR